MRQLWISIEIVGELANGGVVDSTLDFPLSMHALVVVIGFFGRILCTPKSHVTFPVPWTSLTTTTS